MHFWQTFTFQGAWRRENDALKEYVIELQARVILYEDLVLTVCVKDESLLNLS